MRRRPCRTPCRIREPAAELAEPDDAEPLAVERHAQWEFLAAIGPRPRWRARAARPCAGEDQRKGELGGRDRRVGLGVKTRMPRALHAARSSVDVRLPVIATTRRFGSRAMSRAGRAVRSRSSTTTSNGASLSASSSSSRHGLAKTVRSARACDAAPVGELHARDPGSRRGSRSSAAARRLTSSQRRRRRSCGGGRCAGT